MVCGAAIFLEFVKFQQFDIVPGITLAVDLACLQRIMRAVQIERVDIRAKFAEEVLIELRSWHSKLETTNIGGAPDRTDIAGQLMHAIFEAAGGKQVQAFGAD